MLYLENLLDETESDEVEEMIRRHAEYTGSELAWKVLAQWEEMIPRFVKVMPRDYKRMLEAITQSKELGLSGEEAVMKAFVQNKEDMARVSGN